MYIHIVYRQRYLGDILSYSNKFHVNILESDQQLDVKWGTLITPVPSSQSTIGVNYPADDACETFSPLWTLWIISSVAE